MLWSHCGKDQWVVVTMVECHGDKSYCGVHVIRVSSWSSDRKCKGRCRVKANSDTKANNMHNCNHGHSHDGM